MLRSTDVWFRHHRRQPWVLRGVAVEVGPSEIVGPRSVQLVPASGGRRRPALAARPDPRRGGGIPGRPDGRAVDQRRVAAPLSHELSGGELQLVAVARALLSGARYLVADEISAMLDPVTQAQIWHVLRGRVRAGQLGILAISHDGGLLDAVAAVVVAAVSGDRDGTESVTGR